MKQDFNFFKVEMPESRKADFYLGCLDGSVFIDFNLTGNNLISLCRISFDGYGCCNIDGTKNLLNSELSKLFIDEISKDELSQEKLTPLTQRRLRPTLWPFSAGRPAA